jgi:HK97 family phage major capsid protein
MEEVIMSLELVELLKEVRATRDTLGTTDERRNHRIDQFESAINDIMRRIGRPGIDGGPNTVDERKSACDYLQLHHALKAGPQAQPIDFGPQELDQAAIARKAFAPYLRSGDFARMIEPEKKALSEFSMGNIGILVPPEISDRILSCLTDPGDLAGTVDSMTISSGAVQFLVDNVDGEGLFGWACESDCTFNQPGAEGEPCRCCVLLQFI